MSVITISHFKKRGPRHGAWEKVKFFYQKEGEDFFRVGGDPDRHLSREEMKEKESNGSATKLDTPIETTSKDRILWVDSSGVVWFATIQNPIQDKTKKRITQYSPELVS